MAFFVPMPGFGFGAPEIRRRLRDARDIGKGKILRDDRAPAVRAEFDLRHGKKLNLQIRQRRVVRVDNLPHFFDGGFEIALAKQGRAG